MANQTNVKKISETEVFRTGYALSLSLLFIVGICLIAIGEGLFKQNEFFKTLFIGCGISMAPASIVAMLFRYFLFKEIQYQLSRPVIDEVKEKIGPEIIGLIDNMLEKRKNEFNNLIENHKSTLKEIIENYRSEITLLQSLKDAGSVKPYRDRKNALQEFSSAIDAEVSEIMIIGSSLKGLVQLESYKEIANKLKFKITSGKVEVKFLLTHPGVADLRASQEARLPKDIGNEIIKTLRKLQEWQVPEENVRLYKGTPTCFAIKTKSKMFLNTYPYIAVAYDSPCLVIETDDKRPSYFYSAFDKAHFGAWDTNVAERISDYNSTIKELENNLDNYAKVANEMVKIKQASC